MSVEFVILVPPILMPAPAIKPMLTSWIKIVVIWRTEPIIPNDNISFSSAMPEDVGAKIQEAFLAMADSDEGKEILKNAGYEIQGLKVSEDSFYDAFRAALQASGVDITTMVK